MGGRYSADVLEVVGHPSQVSLEDGSRPPGEEWLGIVVVNAGLPDAGAVSSLRELVRLANLGAWLEAATGPGPLEMSAEMEACVRRRLDAFTRIPTLPAATREPATESFSGGLTRRRAPMVRLNDLPADRPAKLVTGDKPLTAAQEMPSVPEDSPPEPDSWRTRPPLL